MVRAPIYILILSVLFTAGCAKNPDAGTQPTQSKLFGDIGSEKAYCSTVSTPSPSVTLTSRAQFQYRVVSASGLGSASTGDIRYAEVQVTNSSGTTVQCGETDSTGNISVAIPKAAGTYTLKVLSRADNSNLKASILDNPTAMNPYSISVSFTLDGSETSKAVTLPTADYRNSLEGGAFNILDQIYASNLFIRNNSTCASLGNVCTAFTVAPKVRVFWIPGLSPGAYLGEPTASISFFTESDEPSLGIASGIYMMGGVNGDICKDTDHFDNSVIIHEYGHFLEYAIAKSDSPGGSHTGDSVIDPRLAWSEGWGNFLQGAVRSSNRYRDTKGNSECSTGTGLQVNLDLENIQVGQDYVSTSTYLGEGIFREVSVTRTLWDIMEAKTGGDGKGAGVGFAYIWKIFSDASSGFKSASIQFRNMGHFNELMRSLINTSANSQLTDYDDVILNERQRSDRVEYARVVTAKVDTCTFDLRGNSVENNYASTNDFFNYYYDGSAARQSLTLKYSATPSGTPSDLDIYVWKNEHSLADLSTAVDIGNALYPESGSPGTEIVSLAGSPAGYYLIQVHATPVNAGATSRYYITTNGGSERLCP